MYVSKSTKSTCLCSPTWPQGTDVPRSYHPAPTLYLSTIQHENLLYIASLGVHKLSLRDRETHKFLDQPPLLGPYCARELQPRVASRQIAEAIIGITLSPFFFRYHSPSLAITISKNNCFFDFFFVIKYTQHKITILTSFKCTVQLY